jgi:hypothetical protein
MNAVLELVRRGILRRFSITAVLWVLWVSALSSRSILIEALVSVVLLVQLALVIGWVVAVLKLPPMRNETIEVQAPTLRWKGPPRMKTLQPVRVGARAIAGVVLGLGLATYILAVGLTSSSAVLVVGGLGALLLAATATALVVLALLQQFRKAAAATV